MAAQGVEGFRGSGLGSEGAQKGLGFRVSGFRVEDF